jgi:hypothetical protein
MLVWISKVLKNMISLSIILNAILKKKLYFLKNKIVETKKMKKSLSADSKNPSNIKI